MFMEDSTNEEVIICTRCNGGGRELQRVSAYDSESVPCCTCLGTGRIIKRTEITYKPFKN